MEQQVERALVVVAHPDDVDFGAGGTIATWTDAGDRGHLLHRHRRRRRRLRPGRAARPDRRDPAGRAARRRQGGRRRGRRVPRLPGRAADPELRPAPRHLARDPPGAPAAPAHAVAGAQLGADRRVPPRPPRGRRGRPVRRLPRRPQPLHPPRAGRRGARGVVGAGDLGDGRRPGRRHVRRRDRRLRAQGRGAAPARVADGAHGRPRGACCAPGWAATPRPPACPRAGSPRASGSSTPAECPARRSAGTSDPLATVPAWTHRSGSRCWSRR